ncbi:MAG: proteinral secretion pathway protein D [bacterium]|nr:MAG: proteinral secretion pathway protein D [bacterium]
MKISLCFHKKVAFLLMLVFLFSPSITFAEKPTKHPQQKRTSQPKSKFPLHNFTFDSETTLATIIHTIAEFERINVIVEDNIAKLVENKKVTFVAKDISAPQALEMLLSANRLSYAPIGKKTIMIFVDALANKQRYEQLMVRVFYLKNANLDDAAKAIQQTLGSKQLVTLKQLNALMVRDTEETLKLIEALLTRIDKSHAEFVMDVNLYEVNDQTALQLGNQLGGLSANDFSLLQNKASSKLIGSTKLHAFENEAASLNIGNRVPMITKTIRTATHNPPTPGTEKSKQPEQQSGQNNDNVGNQTSSLDGEQIQYVNFGLNMELSPKLSQDYVQMKVTIELSGATKALPNVEFNQHRVKETISIKKDETKIVANTFPLVGNFVASSAQKSNNANLIITITPHVIRAPELTPLDRTAFGPNGTSIVFDASVSLEKMIIRAEQDEEQPK